MFMNARGPSLLLAWGRPIVARVVRRLLLRACSIAVGSHAAPPMGVAAGAGPDGHARQDAWFQGMPVARALRTVPTKLLLEDLLEGTGVVDHERILGSIRVDVEHEDLLLFYVDESSPLIPGSAWNEIVDASRPDLVRELVGHPPHLHESGDGIDAQVIKDEDKRPLQRGDNGRMLARRLAGELLSQRPDSVSSQRCGRYLSPKAPGMSLDSSWSNVIS